MYNYDKRQYIFKQSDGRTVNIFFDEKLGLCHCHLTSKGTWSEATSISRNSHPLFYADMDSEDCFHILSQSREGNIIYFFLKNLDIKTFTILTSRTSYTYNKHLFLVPLKNAVHLFYVLKHDSSLIFAHQLFTNNVAGYPKVIDYITGDPLPHCIVFDKWENIYAFYRSTDGKYLQLGYKKYLSDRKIWGEFIPVTSLDSHCEYAKVICDTSNVIHMCCQSRPNKQYELVYKQKTPDKNIWSRESVLCTSPHSFDNLSILQVHEKLIIYWVHNDIIYYCLSENSGSIWSKASRYNFPTGRHLMCITYKSNLFSDSDSIIAPYIPGNFINGFKLAFYQHNSPAPKNEAADSLKSLVGDELKVLKENFEGLKKAVQNNSEDSLKLISSQENIEKEIIKLSLRLNLIENELNQLRQIESRLDSLRLELDDLKAEVPLKMSGCYEFKDRIPHIKALMNSNFNNNTENPAEPAGEAYGIAVRGKEHEEISD